MAPSSSKSKKGHVRLCRLEVKDFKALDHLVLDFPAPLMEDEPDVLVLGSRNGLGKTSVLEACALLLVSARLGDKELRTVLRRGLVGGRSYDRQIDFSDLFVRSGAEEAVIDVDVDVDDLRQHAHLTISRNARTIALEPVDFLLGSPAHLSPGAPFSRHDPEQLVESLMSFGPEPLIMPPLLYFHSFRKVAEGAPEFGDWVEGGSRRRRFGPGNDRAVSAFKLEILGLLMRRADLFENVENGKEESEEALDQVNSFLERYAGGRIDKLRPAPDNTIDFRIMPTGGGRSFSFDGLSSGQKEVISTLFLAWRNTRAVPGVILIDEPELHLNPEWQRGFIQQLHDLTRGSQLIIATHSEDVFGSVPEDRRILLEG